jgi:ADP-ribose pyrophosphatase YjhB (NUDIX family)
MEIHTFCSYCGVRFPDDSGWPRRCPACGHTTYRNPLPVAVVLVPVGDGLVVIRRNTDPKKGTLTFPGGFIDSGEGWQEAARRELLEETGIDVPEEEIALYDVQTGLDDTLVITGLAPQQPETVVKPFACAETQEVLLIHEPITLGFPLHTILAERYFSEKNANRQKEEGTT